MNEIKELELELGRAIGLLVHARLDEWAAKLEQIRKELAVDPRAAASSLIRLYGGIGSINDLILYRDGQPLIAENNELDQLRERMYDLSTSI